MVKKKQKRRKQGWFSKLKNIGLIALGISRPLAIIFSNVGSPQEIGPGILRGLTFGLSDGAGGFSLDKGLQMYTPVAGAVGLGTLLSFLQRKFPVRR